MRQSTRVRRLLAALVGLMGVVHILSALLVHGPLYELLFGETLGDVLPLAIEGARWSVTLAVGFGLLVLARGLWRGKRVAWVLTLVALGATLALRLFQEANWNVTIGTLLVAGLLVSQHKQFTRRSDPPTIRRVPTTLAVGIVAITVYGLAGFALLRAFQPFSPVLALRELFAQMVWVDGPYAPHIHGHALWFLDSIGMLSATLGIGVLLLALRPVLPQQGRRADRERATEFVRQFGTSSLAPFALTDDKLLYFGEDVPGIVAYCVAHGVAVVCGDPIADPEHVGQLAREFAAFCAQQDWQLCFYEVQPRHLPDYAPLG